MIGYGNSMFLATHGILAKSASGAAVDPDAQAFITAASITDPTQQAAINTLVVSLKGYNIWTKFKAIYPIVGGVASSHVVNLKTPGTFNLSFTNAWTHSSTGMTPNGLNTYANTSFNPFNNLSDILSSHTSIYSRTQSRSGADLGINISGSELTISADLNLSGIYALSNIGTQYAGNLTANASTGFFVANRQNATNNKIIRNNVTLATQTTSSGNTKPNGNIYIGAINQNNATVNLYTNRELAFASIGDGLTDTDAANFYTAVQAYQTTLSRQV